MNVDDIKIGGMSCASCAKAVERAVKKLDSSVQASVNMATEKLSISYDKEKVKTELEKLECMKPENQVQPKDAYITFEDTLFTIVPGEEGTAVKNRRIH